MTEVYALMKELKDLGARIYAVDGQLKLDIKQGALTQEIAEKIKRHRDDILALVTEKSSKNNSAQIEKVSEQASYALSDGQRRLWILSQFEEASVAYNMRGSMHLSVELNINWFKKAIDATIDRHEILRTVFKENETGEIRQWVLNQKELNFNIDYKDFRNEKNNEALVNDYINEDSYKPFDLKNGPLLRASILQLTNNTCVFYYNMHHIISDGWSMEVLSKDVMSYYEAYKENKECNLMPLRIQYKDYSAWQVSQLSDQSFITHQDYWLNKLSGELTPLNFPTSKQRPKHKTHNGRSLNTSINRTTTDKLKKYSQQNGGSLFMGLLAVWNILSYRYTSQTDIIIGTPVAGREHTDLEDQIGFYINTLVLRNEVRSEETFNDFYERIKNNTLKSYEHQEFPFDKIVKELNIPRDITRNAVFDVSITYHNISEIQQEDRSEDEISDQVYSFGSAKVKNDIELHFHEGADYISFNLIYNEDVYDQPVMEGLMIHYKQLLSGILSNPEVCISKAEFLLAREKQELLFGLNDTKATYQKEKTIVSIFEEQVSKTPDSIAVMFNGKELTYQELNNLSNQLAHSLKENYAIKPDDLVGIQLERSEWFIVSILGVLKAGGAYVPIDPEYPSARKEQIIKDASLKLLITEANFIHEIDYYDGNVFAIDVEFESEVYSSENPNSTVSANNLAYVIYTSGSTGKPKGVMVEHQAILNTLQSQIEYFQLDARNKGLQFASYSFDASIWETFLMLLCGARLLIVGVQERNDPQLLADFIKVHEIDIATLPPTYVSKMELKELKGLRKLITAGESAIYEKALEQLENGIYYNAYGPTETSICGTIFKLENKEDLLSNYLPIGKPISNTQIYILSEQGQLVAKGVAGEICIGGSGLARGYLNEPDLTNEKFIANPFIEGERIYKTGDLGRWTKDNNIEFIGRKDEQVKIRGHRIELGEIEHALRNHTAIEEAVVLSKENNDKVNELVAYFTSKTQQNAGGIRAYLKELLPEYMLPTHFIQLESFPINTSGKVNKKLLPSPKGLSLISKIEYVAPGNELEETLVQIWSEVLGIEKEIIGTNNKFFELGGDSIKVLRLIADLKNKTSVQLSVAEIYNYDTIEKIAGYVSSNKKEIDVRNKEKIESEQSIRKEIQSLKERIQSSLDVSAINEIEDVYPMSDIEKGMVFGYLMNRDLGIYHDQMIYQRKFLDFDLKLFQKTLELLAHKHSILRTGFNLGDYEREVQIVYTNPEIDLQFEDISDLTSQSQEIRIKEYLKSERDRGFVISEPLWRMSLFAIGNDKYAFVFQCHHAIIDGWSEASFMTELNNIYLELVKNVNFKPTALKSNYKDYIVHHEMDKKNNHIRSFWKSELSRYERLDILTDQEELDSCSRIDNGYLNKIEEFAKKLNTTAKVVSLSAYLYTLKLLNYSNEIVTGLVVNNRPPVTDGDKILGCFLNTIPLRIQADSNLRCSDFVLAVDRKLNDLKKYERLSLPEIASICREKPDQSNPFFDMLFNYVDFHAFNEVAGYDTDELNNAHESNIHLTGHGRTNTFFNFTVNTTGGGYGVLLKATKKLKSELPVSYIVNVYFKVLDFILKNPDSFLKNADYLSSAEKNELLELLNSNEAPYPKGKTIVELFKDQVSELPEKIAIISEEGQLSYRELDELSNQLANYLQAKYDIKPDDLVAIKQKRSQWLVISVLGILKSGGAYVPIDPDYPQDRISYIESDSKCKVCLDEIELDQFKNKQNQYSKEFAVPATKPDNLAYVIYTSGSSGKPKGVMVEHITLVNLCFWHKTKFQVTAKDQATLYAGVAFDASVWELFPYLISGAGLCIVPEKIRVDVNELNTYYEENNITISFLPTVVAEQFMEIENNSLRYLLTGGDKLNQFKKQNYQLVNNYGPTENTVVATSYNVGSHHLNIPIGKPISNVKIYILNQEGQLQAKGVVGELHITGASLARGYLNQEELTKEKFIASSFNEGERLYKTGDLGRWTKDGNIEFAGRKDDQVKVRGYRIELGEIEHALLINEQIKEVVVHTKENQNNQKEIVAYYTSETEQNSVSLRNQLKKTLPDYMLPVHYIHLDSIPLNANGKIDKNLLPDPQELNLQNQTEYVAPRNEIEVKLVEIWQDVLQRENIGIKDDFFELGGHSLKAVRVIAKIQEAYGVKFELNKIFQATTIEQCGEFISILSSDYSNINSEMEEFKI